MISLVLMWVTALAAIFGAVAAFMAWRKSAHDGVGQQTQLALEAVTLRLASLADAQERDTRALRAELAESARVGRQEQSDAQTALRAELGRNIEALRATLGTGAQAARQELSESVGRLTVNLNQQLQQLTALNDQRFQEIRHTMDGRLQSIQSDNAIKLEEMRRTVDEKLHATLEQRLGESFRLVSDRLEAVHKGLGEMQALAAGVGDLKRVLTNVKSRGTWGEVQLERLIEDTMVAGQYGRNVKPIPGSEAIVEFAIRLPGRDTDSPVWLPIDAKFPKEEYERLLQAQDAADMPGIQAAANGLGRAVEAQARQIAEKYIAPPHTTDFGIMFLPTEGLYAEVLRLPGLVDRLQGLRVSVAGPSNLAAMLNSLQMGFRTLAIERRSSEVWQVLRAVKTEFGKFGDALSAVKKSLDSASDKIGKTEVRTRVMLRSLKTVEALPETQAEALLGQVQAEDESGEASEPEPSS